MRNNNKTKFKETEIGAIPEEWESLELEKLKLKVIKSATFDGFFG